MTEIQKPDSRFRGNDGMQVFVPAGLDSLHFRHSHSFVIPTKVGI